MSSISMSNGFEQTLNPEFRRVVRSFKRALPYVSTTFLFVVYAVSAWAGGSLLSKVTGNALASGVILAYAISVAIQIGRMVLVFYPLLNPTRPSMGYTGEVTGVLLGIVAIIEIWSSNTASGLHQAIAVSLTILMAIGVLAELYLLKEIKYYLKMELMSNPTYIAKLKKFFVDEKKFDKLLNDLEQGIIPDEDTTTTTLASDQFDITKIDMAYFDKEVIRRAKALEDDLALTGKEAVKQSLADFEVEDLGNSITAKNRVRLNGVPFEPA